MNGRTSQWMIHNSSKGMQHRESAYRPATIQSGQRYKQHDGYSGPVSSSMDIIKIEKMPYK